jgi:hypothetical protein
MTVQHAAWIADVAVANQVETGVGGLRHHVDATDSSVVHVKECRKIVQRVSHATPSHERHDNAPSGAREKGVYDPRHVNSR